MKLSTLSNGPKIIPQKPVGNKSRTKLAPVHLQFNFVSFCLAVEEGQTPAGLTEVHGLKKRKLTKKCTKTKLENSKKMTENRSSPNCTKIKKICRIYN